ncbi:MAG: energy transducer TonB [Candidatus Neomarinimicrobiota bacterium]
MKTRINQLILAGAGLLLCANLSALGNPAKPTAEMAALTEIKKSDPEKVVREYQELLLERLPQPIGGYAAIGDNIVYPENDGRITHDATVVVWAYINSRGDVEKISVIQGVPGTGFDAAALTAIRKVKWQAAVREGHPVAVGMYIPVVFKAQ